MPARERPPQPRGSGPPTRMPEGTPDTPSGMDHSWTLQAIIGLEKSVAVLAEKLDGVRTDLAELGAKIDDNCEKVRGINTTLARWTTGGAVIAAVVLILWSIANLVPWERISIKPAEAEPPAATAPAKAPEPKAP